MKVFGDFNYIPKELDYHKLPYKEEIERSTSGRGARALYQTMLTEISARRSLLWTKVQIAVARQWGREMSAPRPLETDPFHSLGSIL